MEKIAIGYAFLLVWCYTRAELAHRAKASDDASGEGARRLSTRRLRLLSALLVVAGLTLTVWGSGWNCIFWVPSGFVLTGLIQTLLPIRKTWH